MAKKLFIFVFIILVIAAGFYAYKVFFTNNPAPQPALTAPETPLNNPFPTASSSATSLADLQSTTPSSTSAASTTRERDQLTQLANDLVAGSVIFKSSGVQTTRYVYQSNGHIYDSNLNTAASLRVSNLTFPSVAEAVLADSGDRGILRYLKSGTETINSYFFKLGTSTSTASRIAYGYDLPPNISTLAISPDGTEVFYVTDTAEGARGTVENVDTQKKTPRFSSPFHEWQTTWPNPSIIALTTKPGAGIPGYLYFLNPKSGSLKKVLSGINGLTALVNPTGDSVLYGDDALNLYVFNIKTSTTTKLELNTLPEKCVWSRREKNTAYCAASYVIDPKNFPDIWYQGVFTFSDDIYRINSVSGEVALAAEIQNIHEKKLDMFKLSLSPDESILTFINKSDNKLWSYKLK